jgi:hypothetical protein
LATPDWLSKIIDDSNLNDLVFNFMAAREENRQRVQSKSDYSKELQKERHDLGIRREYRFKGGDLVMIYDQKSAKKKLHPVYRGPFVINGAGGDQGKSYTLRQVNGTAIPRTYYGDHLKPFRLRPDHLVTKKERLWPEYQNLRAGQGVHKLPKNVRIEVSQATSQLSDLAFTLGDITWI